MIKVIDYWFDLTLTVLHQHSRQINMVVWVGGRIIIIIKVKMMMTKGCGERVWYSLYISMIFMSFLCASSCSFSFTLLLHNVVCDKYRWYADDMQMLWHDDSINTTMYRKLFIYPQCILRIAKNKNKTKPFDLTSRSDVVTCRVTLLLSLTLLLNIVVS